MIIFDESVDFYWFQLLKNKGFPVYSIAQNNQGMSDSEIIELAKNNQA